MVVAAQVMHHTSFKLQMNCSWVMLQSSPWVYTLEWSGSKVRGGFHTFQVPLLAVLLFTAPGVSSLLRAEMLLDPQHRRGEGAGLCFCLSSVP